MAHCLYCGARIYHVYACTVHFGLRSTWHYKRFEAFVASDRPQPLCVSSVYHCVTGDIKDIHIIKNLSKSTHFKIAAIIHCNVSESTHFYIAEMFHANVSQGGHFNVSESLQESCRDISQLPCNIAIFQWNIYKMFLQSFGGVWI